MKKSDLYIQFDNVLFEKTRLSMLTILYKEGRASFKQFKTIIGGSDGAIFTHLRKLHNADYISQEKKIVDNKAATIYALTPRGKSEFKRYIAFIESVVFNI